MKLWISWLFGVLVGVALTLCILSGVWWGVSTERNWLATTDASRTRFTSASAEEQVIKEKLETYTKRADDLERLLELLVLVSGVSTVALYLNAIRDAKQSSHELRKIVADAEARLPVFTGMKSKIESVFDRLNELLPGDSVDIARSSELSPRAKQEIPYYEMTIAASEYYNLEFMHEKLSKIYHRFGKFYVLKSGQPAPQPTSSTVAAPAEASAPSAATAPAVPAVSQEDLDRARFYFKRAAELDEQNTPALNDLGYLELMRKKVDESRQIFERSLAIDARQQRPRYNLAYIALVHGNDPARSIALLTKALKMPRWQGDQSAQNSAEMQYQRACAHAKLGKALSGKEQTEQFTLGMGDLETAFKDPDRNYAELKEALCGTDGKTVDPDLVPLRDDADQSIQFRFRVLRSTFC